MELHELDVGHRHAGAQRHGQAVARRLERVGRHREHLARATGRSEDVRRSDLAHDAVGGERGHAAAAAALDDAGRGRTNARRPRRHFAARPRPAPARSRRRSPRRPRARPGAACGRPRGPARAGRRTSIEHGPHRDELVDAAGSLVDEDADGVDVAQPGPGGERVGEVQVGRVGIAGEHRGDAALGPAGGGLIELALGEHADAQAERVGGPHRGREPGHAAAQDEQVESRAVARHCRQPTVTPTLSMRRALPNRAAPRRRSSPVSGVTALSDAASTTAT